MVDLAFIRHAKVAHYITNRVMAGANGTSDVIESDTDASDEFTVMGGAWSSCPMPQQIRTLMKLGYCAVTVTSGEQDGITIWLIGWDGRIYELRGTSNITLQRPGQHNWSVTDLQTRNKPKWFSDVRFPGVLIDDELMRLDREEFSIVLWSLNLSRC